MAAFQNIGIDGYFKRYGFKYGIKRALFMINDIHIVKDYENKKILYYHKAQKSRETVRWKRCFRQSAKPS